MKKLLLIFIFFTNLTYSQNDSIPLMNLDNEDYYSTRWITISGNYESFNSLVGLQLSNGFDEEPLIHFEDFQDNFIFKIEGQTDFYKDYTFETGIGILYPIKYIGRAQLGYSKMNLQRDKLELQNLNLQVRSRYFGNTSILLETGFQKLQEKENFGYNLGVQQVFRKTYAGVLVGYYKDYFNLNGYLQYIFHSNQMNLYSFRIEYDRIDNYNFLKFGFHWSFVRT